jgi:hypothetical protein
MEYLIIHQDRLLDTLPDPIVTEFNSDSSRVRSRALSDAASGISEEEFPLRKGVAPLTAIPTSSNSSVKKSLSLRKRRPSNSEVVPSKQSTHTKSRPNSGSGQSASSLPVSIPNSLPSSSLSLSLPTSQQIDPTDSEDSVYDLYQAYANERQEEEERDYSPLSTVISRTPSSQGLPPGAGLPLPKETQLQVVNS